VGGELFVPKIPSYQIMDLAKAIAPECRIEIVGIRPGEKLHEEMITENDAINTLEYRNHYAIIPTHLQSRLTENVGIEREQPIRRCSYGFAYNSGSNSDFLSVDDLRNLIATKYK
jgi:FlaA1/EpsC-like NDP-sugar epimerase